MANIIVTTLVASLLMLLMITISIAATMPFVGSLIRLRANYNPRAVGLEGAENQ
jgi:hypothetical protein